MNEMKTSGIVRMTASSAACTPRSDLHVSRFAGILGNTSRQPLGPGIRLNEHIEGDGPTVFAHARRMGLEGIVSKRKDSAYRSGRSPDWLKMKNSNAPAVKREAEEDWAR